MTVFCYAVDFFLPKCWTLLSTEEISAPFDKDHLRSQIEAGGGSIVETLDNKLVGTSRAAVFINSDFRYNSSVLWYDYISNSTK